MSLLDLDKKLFFLINHGTVNALFDIVMPFLTARGYLLILPYMAYMLLKSRSLDRYEQGGHLQTALWAVCAAVFSFLLTDWVAGELKPVIGRLRPCNVLEGVRLLAGCSKSGSMPSNHAANSFAYAVPLFFMPRRHFSLGWRLYPLALASLVALSRVYVGVHYPTDIVAGALFGTAVAFLVMLLYKYGALRYETKPHTTLLFAFMLIISIFRVYYILQGPLDLSPDEAHYWEWARRPDLSYYSKGPVIAWLIYIGTALFGDTVFGIRVMAVLFSALSSFLLFRLSGLLYKDQAVALFSALLLQAIPLFAPFGIIFTIDSPFVFFWILSLLLFWKAISAGHGTQMTDDRYSGIGTWLVLGVSVGLGLLTKYTMAFFCLCAFMFLLFSEKKYLLKTAKPYAALILSLLIFSPVIIWNVQHDWVTLRHTAGQAHVAEGINISLRSFFEFFGSQIGVITPVIFFMMFYALLKLQRSDDRLQSRFLLYFSIPVVAFFLLKSIQGKVQANWAMTGYITGIVALASYFLRQKSKGRRTDALLWTGVGLAVFVTAMSHYPALLKLPARLDPSTRLKGWKELGTEVSRLNGAISDKGQVFVFSDSYQVSSELAFYVKGHPKTYCINLGRRMNQYDLWPDMNSDAMKIRQGNGGPINAVFVRTGNADMPKEVADAFDRFEKRPLQVYDKKGRPIREYSLFICYNFKTLGIKQATTF